MKISLLEPLRVSEDYIQELAKPLIEAGHEFEYFSEKTTDPDELFRRSQDAEIVVIANNPYPEAVVSKLEKTKLINVAFTGVDHVPVELASQQGIKVANASGYANQAVAELSIGLTLALYRHLFQGDQDIRKADQYPGPIQGQEIKGKTVGIVGTGSIGLATAKLFKAFGANLVGYNRTEKPAAKELGLVYCSLETLLRESDIVSLHLPLNDQTKHLIGQEELAMMKESSVLINVARGPIVDNAALAYALNQGVIGGAGIDVFDMEPPLSADYPILTAKNAILAPHIGFLTDEAMEHRAKIIFDNIHAYIAGHPTNIVNE